MGSTFPLSDVSGIIAMSCDEHGNRFAWFYSNMDQYAQGLISIHPLHVSTAALRILAFFWEDFIFKNFEVKYKSFNPQGGDLVLDF